MWCVAELDEKHIERMEDVLALYERPYDAAEPVVCLDEKPIFPHKEVRPSRPAAPGHAAKRDNEHQRCGTANVFAVVEPKAGRHFTSATPHRTAAEFAKTLGSLLDRYPSARTMRLVWDNLNMHCKKSLTDYHGKKQGGEMWSRLTIHPTPLHGSWLNQAEMELSLYSRQCLGSRRIPGRHPMISGQGGEVSRGKVFRPTRGRRRWAVQAAAARYKQERSCLLSGSRKRARTVSARALWLRNSRTDSRGLRLAPGPV